MTQKPERQEIILQKLAFRRRITPELYEASTVVSRSFIGDLSFRLYHQDRQKDTRQTALFLLLCLIPKRNDNLDTKISDYICDVIGDVSDLPLLLGMYWKNKKLPNSRQFIKGLARAFEKFTEEDFLGYPDLSPVKLRDVLFLCQPKPRTKEQEMLFKKIANNTLQNWQQGDSSLLSFVARG